MAKKEVKFTAEEANIKHIGFIMDGNGRWAKKRGMPREYGHKFGADVFEKIMDYCCHMGIAAQTFYVFSTENWKRPQKEVDSIMKLLDNYLDDCEKRLKKNDVRFIFLGDKSVFPEHMRQKMIDIERNSASYKYIVNLALNYGGRDEIVMAVNKLVAQGKTELTEEDISSALYTNESPELDLIVRTGGDMRISNFLLWQSAYAELYFTDVLWPDFKSGDVDAAVENYMNRKRRFGGV
ncbi:MAG: di-trans,poly-cis-decaprenylcistransferase [Clostridia bacterium]|nr:di-trans,poly-cis-decaprenylcistransferase [Clostridia bacterium]